MKPFVSGGIVQSQPLQETHKNRGTGAGGANTNYFGKQFEQKTDSHARLLSNGFVSGHAAASASKKHKPAKHEDYLFKDTDAGRMVFVTQNGLKVYMKHRHGIDLFRCPDEAYLIELTCEGEGGGEGGGEGAGTKKKTIIKILEKKEQKVDGSVETKLWSGPSLKREYEIVLGDRFEVHYAFCVNEFLKQKLVSDAPKYKTLNTILKEADIQVLFGDDPDYFEQLDNWVNSS